MNVNDVYVGKKAYYHPIVNSPNKKEVTITSKPFQICGTYCCMVDSVSSCVSLESLSEI